MKNIALATALIAVGIFVVRDIWFPNVIRDRVVETEVVIERDSTWIERALTAEEEAANLEEIIRSFKPEMVRVSDVKYDTIRSMVRDTVRMVQQINIDFLTHRGRDSVHVFADLYPSLGTVLWRGKWNDDWTQVVTERVTETNTVLKRFTWGFQAGAGLGVRGPDAYVGFGINFNLGGL